MFVNVDKYEVVDYEKQEYSDCYDYPELRDQYIYLQIEKMANELH